MAGVDAVLASLDLLAEGTAEAEGEQHPQQLQGGHTDANPHEQVGVIFYPVLQSTVATL